MCGGSGCIYGGITRKWCHGTGYKYDGYQLCTNIVMWCQQPIGGQTCQLWTNERPESLYLHTGVDCQRFRANPDNERILRESPEKLRHPHSHSHCHSEQEGALCQSCEGPDDNDVIMMIRGCLIMMMYIGDGVAAFCLKWSAERKWNEISNEHPAVQCSLQHRCRQILNAVSQHICTFETDICIGK